MSYQTTSSRSCCPLKILNLLQTVESLNCKLENLLLLNDFWYLTWFEILHGLFVGQLLIVLQICLVLNACLCRFGHVYSNLQSRLTKTLQNAFLDPKKAMTQHYGAIQGLGALGPNVVCSSPCSWQLWN